MTIKRASQLAALATLAAMVSPPASAQVLQGVADIPLPGPAVRFDYQSVDVDADRLYIAHMNADKLVVFDLKTREVVGDLDGFENVHGVIAVPAKHRGPTVLSSALGEG